jgi:hypothetical protein
VTQAEVVHQSHERPVVADDRDAVAEVRNGRSELDGVQLAAAHRHVVRVDQYFQPVSTHLRPPTVVDWRRF